MDLKPGQYQGALKMLSAAEEALLQAMGGVKRQQEPRTLRRLIEECEGFLKRAKRELRIG